MLSSSDQETNAIECRICHSKTTRDLILSPCLCKGSMGCVHIHCLEQWLNVSSHNFCELCSYKFEVIQARRYSLGQSIVVWLRQENNTFYKALFFVVLSAINSIFLCWMWVLWITSVPDIFFSEKESIDNNDKSSDEFTEKDHEISKPKWIIVFVFLTLLTAFSIKSLCCDAYKVLKNQLQLWYRWWNETVNIQLVLDLQNYKINAKLEETTCQALNHMQTKSQDEIGLEEIKVLDPLDDSDSNLLCMVLPEVHKSQQLHQDCSQKD